MTKIGEGAAGQVFVATHVKTGNKVAIKKMEINSENIKLLVTEIGTTTISRDPCLLYCRHNENKRSPKYCAIRGRLHRQFKRAVGSNGVYGWRLPHRCA